MLTLYIIVTMIKNNTGIYSHDFGKASLKYSIDKKI